MKLIVSVVVILALLVGGLILAPNFVDWNSYKGEAEKQVKKFTGLDLKINGDISLALLPSPRVYLEDVAVQDPKEAGEVLAGFKLLDVRVGLAALLEKKVDVEAVHLNEPTLRLVQDANGRFNFMTPELEAIQSSKSTDTEDKASSSDNAQAFEISFKDVVVDNGKIKYITPSQTIDISELNLDVNADGLQGPFSGGVSMLYAGQKVSGEFKTGAIDLENMSTSVSMNGSLDAIILKFVGVVKGGEAASAKGDVDVSIPDFGSMINNDALNGTLALKGSLDANAKQAALKNASINLGDIALNGSIVAGLSPMSVQGQFASNKVLTLDNLLPKKSGDKSSSPLAIAQALPQTLELPVMGALDIKLSAPAVVYNGQTFTGTDIAISKVDKGFKLGLNVGGLPGGGAAKVDSSLSFAEKSYSGASGKDIYSSPSVNVQVNAQSSDLPKTVEALSGLSGLPLVSSAKKGVLDAKARVTRGGLYLDSAVINLDQAAYSAKGSLTGQDGSQRDLLKASVVADTVDLDAIVNGSKQSKSSGSTGGDMPFDIQADATVNTLKMSGQTVRGLNVGVNMSGKKLVVKKLKAGDFSGNKLDIKSDITVDMSGSKPALSGSLALGDLVWRAPKTAAQAKGTERWSSALMDFGWLNTVDIDFDVSANSIDYEGWVLAKPSIDVLLENGVLNINSLKAGLFNGTISGNGQVEDLGGSGVSLGGHFDVAKVDMEPMVKAFAGNRILKGSGDINMSSDLNASGASMKQIINALNGNGVITGSNIVIEGVDVQRFVRALSDDIKPGDSAMNLWKGVGTQGGSTSFETLDGAYTITNGVVNLSKLLLDGPRTAINTTGQINLPAWTIKTAHEMSVKDRDDVPSFTVNISGPLDNPGQTLAQGVLNDYIKRKLERKVQKVLGDKLGEKLDKKLGLDGVLNGVIGGSGASQSQQEPANDNGSSESGEGEGQQQPQSQPTPEDAVRGLIKGFMR